MQTTESELMINGDHVKLQNLFFDLLKQYKDHLEEMTAINAAMDYRLTNQLTRSYENLTKLLRDHKIDSNKELN
jgi:hypothetical protein